MTTPRYTKRIVEELNLNFTHNTQYDNKFARGRELERDEIDQQWTRLIQRTYPADDPKSYELLAQVECPLYNTYWEKRKDLFEREHRFGLCASNRSRLNPTKPQKRKGPGCIIIEDHECKSFLVPRISLVAIQQLSYMDFVESVLRANPRQAQNMSKFTMQELWVAVVTKIYHFEDTLDEELKIGETNECTSAMFYALVEDYRSAYEVAKERVDPKEFLQKGKR